MDNKTSPTHMLPTGDPSEDKRPTQTESEGLETNFPSKWTGKRTWGSNTYISDKIDFKKSHKKRPERSLHHSQVNNPSRAHKHCKFICIQHRSTQIHKENLGELQERY